MPQPCFDRLSERLLRSGIAPRHVRRYVHELSDHFDDLVREEIVGGAARDLAETRALARLGNDDDLANAMLSRPELRSLTARFPWAVFGLGPIAMVASSFLAAGFVEVGLILSAPTWMSVFGLTPGPVAARGATQVLLVWNTLAIYGAPLFFAWLFYRLGSRQRMPANWIMLDVVLACILGGFQTLSFYDTGVPHGGHFDGDSALIPPFTHFAQGLAHAAMNLAIAGGVWWLSLRRKASSASAYLNA